MGLHGLPQWPASVENKTWAPKPSLHHSPLPSVLNQCCLSPWAVNRADGPFRHLSIFNQPPPLTQQLLPNWSGIDYHLHHNSSASQRQEMIKILSVKLINLFMQPVCLCVCVCVKNEKWLYYMKVGANFHSLSQLLPVRHPLVDNNEKKAADMFPPSGLNVSSQHWNKNPNLMTKSC